MSSSATPTLQSFDPHAVHYFTSAATSSRPVYTHTGVPRAAYPTHVLVASTSPASRAIQPPKNNSVPSQSTPQVQSSSPVVQIQAPQPIVQAKGFAVAGTQAAAARSSKGPQGRSIFEPFSHKRSVTPELDDVLKKKAAPWGQWELEQSFHSAK
jgi:hypothetical protein